LIFDDKVIVTQKQYGRAWAMTRLDNRTGAMCEMLPADLGTKDRGDSKISTVSAVGRPFRYSHLPVRYSRMACWWRS
jgi:hypothetical protein